MTAALTTSAGPLMAFGASRHLLSFQLGCKLTLRNTEEYDILSALGSSEYNGQWPFILRVLKWPGRSLPDHVKTQNCRRVPW